MIDNQAYCQRSSNADVFKTRYILNNGDRGAISAVGFSTDDKYMITQSDNGSTRHWKTDAFPYIEIRSAPTEHNNTSISGVHYMVPAIEDTPEYALFHYAQTIHEQTGKVVAEFPNAKGLGIEKDGKTRSTQHGEFLH
jgi:hypothetical protein